MRHVRSVADLTHKARSAGRLFGMLSEGLEVRNNVPPGRVTPLDL